MNAAVRASALRRAYLRLALGLLRELGEIESDPPFATPERGWPRIYSLRASALLEPLPLLSKDEPYEGDAGGPEVPEDEDVPGIAAAGRWSSKAPPSPGPRPPSRSMSGVLGLVFLLVGYFSGRWPVAMVGIIAAAPLARPAVGPSFDCRRAHTSVETTICNSDELSAADMELARALRGAIVTGSKLPA